MSEPLERNSQNTNNTFGTYIFVATPCWRSAGPPAIAQCAATSRVHQHVRTAGLAPQRRLHVDLSSSVMPVTSKRAAQCPCKHAGADNTHTHQPAQTFIQKTSYCGGALQTPLPISRQRLQTQCGSKKLTLSTKCEHPVRGPAAWRKEAPAKLGLLINGVPTSLVNM